MQCLKLTRYMHCFNKIYSLVPLRIYCYLQCLYLVSIPQSVIYMYWLSFDLRCENGTYTVYVTRFAKRGLPHTWCIITRWYSVTSNNQAPCIQWLKKWQYYAANDNGELIISSLNISLITFLCTAKEPMNHSTQQIMNKVFMCFFQLFYTLSTMLFP